MFPILHLPYFTVFMQTAFTVVNAVKHNINFSLEENPQNSSNVKPEPGHECDPTTEMCFWT